MAEISFKERVRTIAIAEARNYKTNFVDSEYLVCSSAFTRKDFYIIDAKEDNYQHLIGVHSLVSAQEFFDKCYNDLLEETDFDFIKDGQAESDVIGSVRRKIKVLPNMVNLFYSDLKVEEAFKKNTVSCNFAATDTKCTLGFVDVGKSRPKTLIKGDALKINKMKDVSLLLRKSIGKEKFDEILIGDTSVLMSYYEKIKDYVDDTLIPPSSNDPIDDEVANDLDNK